LERTDQIAQGAIFSFAQPVALVFYEPSTRTEMSFVRACQMVGAPVLRLLPERASVLKGEGPDETVRTLGAIGARVLVMRTAEPLLPHRLSELGMAVVNAGDGCHEHPTQALADLVALRRTVGEVRGLKVLVVGDHLHSRVSRSTVALLSRQGAEVELAGPPDLLPEGFAEMLGARRCVDLDQALAEVDVVMALRIQQERMGQTVVADLAAYRRQWGITAERYFSLGHPPWLMHPGPANLGVEIDPELADASRSLIRIQVTCGTQVRAAVLSLIGEEVA
jgi:aspartate carbamoyltransferase catalytic subunit